MAWFVTLPESTQLAVFLSFCSPYMGQHFRFRSHDLELTTQNRTNIAA
jgi:hypothetical protein